MVIDSVVGEKERKTGEILLAMPLNPSQIILGKSMAVVGIIAIQVALWVIILLATGFQINNPILVYLLVLITSIPIIGVTTLTSAYSKNYKEAGILLTFVYIAVAGVLMVPAMAYLSTKSLVTNISPMTMIIRIFSEETIPLWQFLIPVAFVLVVSIISYWLSIKLFERDDVVFGPRPGLIRLFGINWFEKACWLIWLNEYFFSQLECIFHKKGNIISYKFDNFKYNVIYFLH